MIVPGFTIHGFAERLIIGGVLFVYDDWLDLWKGPGELEYLPSEIHSMLRSGRWKIEVAK